MVETVTNPIGNKTNYKYIEPTPSTPQPAANTKNNEAQKTVDTSKKDASSGVIAVPKSNTETASKTNSALSDKPKDNVEASKNAIS
jgi:hypothetical protein